MIKSIKILCNEKGFSLLEMVIYTAIVTVVITTVLMFAVNIIQGASRATAIQEIHHNGQFSLEKLKYDVQNADSLDLVQSIFDDDNGKLVLVSGSEEIVYSIEDGSLQRKQGASDALKVNSSAVNITKLRFEERVFDNDRVNLKMFLDFSYRNPGSRSEFNISESFNTSVSLRK